MDDSRHLTRNGVVFFDTSGKGYLPPRGLFIPLKGDVFQEFVKAWAAKDGAPTLKFMGDKDEEKFHFWRKNRHNPDALAGKVTKEEVSRYIRIYGQIHQQHQTSSGHPLLSFKGKDVVEKMIRSMDLVAVMCKAGVITVYSLKRQPRLAPEQMAELEELFNIDPNEQVRWSASVNGGRTMAGPASTVLYGENAYGAKFKDVKAPHAAGAVDVPTKWSDFPEVPDWDTAGEYDKVFADWVDRISRSTSMDAAKKADKVLPDPSSPPPTTPTTPPPTIPKKKKSWFARFVKGRPGSIAPGAKITGDDLV